MEVREDKFNAYFKLVRKLINKLINHEISRGACAPKKIASTESLKFKSYVFSLQRLSFIKVHFRAKKEFGYGKILDLKNILGLKKMLGLNFFFGLFKLL